MSNKKSRLLAIGKFQNRGEKMFAFQKTRDDKKIPNNLEAFEKICRPVVKYMQEHTEQFSPHSTIIITVDGAKLVSDEMFVPYELPDDY